jgi:immune inhibitor A
MYKLNNKCLVPPHPGVLKQLKTEFEEKKRQNPDLKIEDFLKSVGFYPEPEPPGKDNPAIINPDSIRKGVIELEEIDVPAFKPTGDIHALALLIDFDDNHANTSKDHYQDLLFSDGSNNNDKASLKDYFKIVSNGKVNFVGQISGWHRMPNPYSYYTNNSSGTDGTAYPRNAKKMVEDAVTIAKEKDNTIEWDRYDLNGDGFIEALYIIHAGPGGETQRTREGRLNSIWSHKWVTQKPVKVTNKTTVAPYLTVPEDGRLGVFAHETGHLVFGWPDLYDACTDGDRTAAVGQWCLMGAGSWNRNGDNPAYPSAWCRYAQGWTKHTRINNNREINVPCAEDIDEVYMIPIKNTNTEYFMVECRRKDKFDSDIPGEGMLIYHIDEKAENNCNENHLAVGVIQADGNRDLQGLNGNKGDDGDPFPGRSSRTFLNSDDYPNTLDYSNRPTNISISNITWDGRRGVAAISLE